jgi:hypothetical protein
MYEQLSLTRARETFKWLRAVVVACGASNAAVHMQTCDLELELPPGCLHGLPATLGRPQRVMKDMNLPALESMLTRQKR